MWLTAKEIKLRNLSIRVEDGFKDRVDDKVHEQRASLQSIGMALFTAWLEANPTGEFGDAFRRELLSREPRARVVSGPDERDILQHPAQATPRHSPEEQAWLDGLLAFLRRGDASPHTVGFLKETLGIVTPAERKKRA